MNGLTAIYKKELKNYFYSPIAYVVIGLFLLMTGVIFTKFVVLYQQYAFSNQRGMAQDVTLDKLALYFYQNVAFFLCFFTPFLTMRLFAEERRQQTLELLLTAPIRISELVLGKFFAAFSLFGIMLLTSLVYTGFMLVWGNPDMNVIFSLYLGLILSLACYISIGGFISAFTSNQFIALVITFFVLILLWLLQSISQGMTASLGPIQLGPLLEYLSPMSHFTQLSEGVLRLKDFVYYVSFIVIMLFFTHKVVESNRWR